MKMIIASCTIGLGLALVASLPSLAGSSQNLPVPSQGLARAVPGAQEVPAPKQNYKVVFDIVTAGPQDKVHPGLASVARYLNTLAEYGVPSSHRHMVVVLHGDATEFVLNNAAYAARNHGQPNPNAALIDEMKKGGVDFRVCGQAVLAKNIAPRDIMPAVQLDLWALSTLVNLQLQGYVHVGGG